MNEVELEEGEACAFMEADYTGIDPDVSLSYIDDKIQNVLGHFKKDFEGLVSVENLGAKYGIYGSFLPTYRRSPVQSHSKSPSRIQNNMASQSPNTMQMEGGHPNSLAQASAPHSVRHGSAPPFVHKAPFQKDLSRQTSRTQSMQSLEECTPKSEVSDHKKLKVRIKVGSDTLSVKESAAIYSGLGLDGSPSSFDGSPMESEGLSLVMPFKVDKSTAQILQMMTSFPLDGGYLLSPLPYDLIQLSERPKVLQGFLTQTSLKANQENSVIGKLKNNKAISRDCGAKVMDRKGLSLQGKRYGEESHVGFDLSFRESDIDAVSCEELISDALKLPLLSNADNTVGESPKASLKEKGYSGTAKGGSLEPSLIEGSISDKPSGKENSERNLVRNRGADAPSGTVNDSGKIGNYEEGLPDKTGSKSKKASKRELKDSRRQKSKNSISREGGKNKLSSGDKKKPKKSEAHGFATRSEAMENALGPAWELKDRNCTETNNRACGSQSGNSSMQKELSKSRDKYKDFFGDFNEQEADLLDSPDMGSIGLKASQAVDEATLVCENTSRQRARSSEIHRGAEAATDRKGFSHKVALSENGGPISDLAPTIEKDDSWVCCDKCHKSRLLPPGSKVDNLPEKWICSMMTWLPDMDCCSISGEETTKALRARYQLLPENPKSTLVPIGGLPTRVAPADISDPIVPTDGKLRKTSKSSFQESPNQLLSSVMKKQQSAKVRTTDSKESVLMNELEFGKLMRSDDTLVETNQQNKIGKHKVDCDSDGDHAKILMIKSKREPDQEFSGISKKSKRATDEDQGDDILGVGSDYGLATNTARKDQMTNSEFVSSRISKHNVEGDSPNVSDKPIYPDDVCLHGSKSDGSIVAPSKRKADNLQHPPNSTLSSDKLISHKEQFNKKKHRTSKSERKERGARNGKADKRRKSILHHSLDNIESLQKDSSVVQPALAATSSASKISGSLEAKSNAQELKESPVESASSPSRISNFGKLMSGNKIIVEKVNVHDVVKLATGSPRKYSDDDCRGGHARSNHVKSSKDTSSLGEDENEMLKYSSGNDKVKISEFVDNPQDKKPGCEGKEGDGKFKDQENRGSSVVKAEKDIMCPNQEPSVLKSKAHVDYDETRSLMKFDAHAQKKPKHLVATSEREKSQHLPPRDGEKNETSNCPQLYQGNGVSILSTGASASGLLKELKPNKKTDSQSRTHHIMSKHSVSNGYRGKNQNTPSPLRRDASSEAARNAIKEARNLKHLADRLKKGNGSSESTDMYFEAALKFLHGASLVESGKTENARHADMVESMKIYSDTAELCEFCAREYEKSKDMAMAALAYKCMEVAYMRVICISHQSASRDRDELQAVLQIVPPGESPSSSASDIDNLNNSTKAPRARSTDAQLSVDLVVTARNRPNFNRLLSFAHNVNLAMEASRKSRIAFTAANVNMDKLDSKEGITSIKRALDFNFHDIDGLLLLVRVAKEVTNR